MDHKTLKASLTAVFIVIGFASTPSYGDKPDWAGGGKHGQGDRDTHGRKDSRESRHEQDNREGAGLAINLHFGDRQRSTAQTYYRNEISRGHCPPGLAKKGNGCLPPGQARKWSRGRPLPQGVVYYDLPPALVVELGIPPAGHRYVRVASDILLIAIGTRMVVDAMEDISGR